MSTYAYAKVYIADKNKNVKAANIDICVNYIKTVLIGSDWPDEFEGFDPELNNVDPTVEDIGYIKRDILKDPEILKHTITNAKELVVIDNWLDTSIYRSQGKIVANVDDTAILANDFVKLQRKTDGYSGVWLTELIVADFCNKLKSKVVKELEEKVKLESLKSSIEYYKLTDEEKESLNDDIMQHDESADMYFDQLESCRQLIGMMDGMKERFSKDWQDEVYCYLYLS